MSILLHIATVSITLLFQCRTPPEGRSELKHDLLSFCRHISAGLTYLSSKHFVHRDLAARNVLVSSDSICKVRCTGGLFLLFIFIQRYVHTFMRCMHICISTR